MQEENSERARLEVSGGLHGVGAKCVNAGLSEWFVAEVQKGWKHTQNGVFPRKDGPGPRIVGSSKSTGTKITFMPDEQIFTETREFKFDVLAKQLRELAFLNPGVKIVLKDDKDNRMIAISCLRMSIGEISMHYTLTKTRTASSTNPFLFPEKHRRNPVLGTIKLEVSLIYNDSFSDQIYSYANSIHNVEGGTHLSGFRTALTRVINNYARQNDMLKEKGSFADWR